MITFLSLDDSHFPLLLKWLETPYVKEGWHARKSWTPQQIQEKYDSYIQGYRVDESGNPRPLQAYVIYDQEVPIGYIQAYDVRDFPRDYSCNLGDLPLRCAALDFYIGEPEYLGKGIGAQALELFLKDYIFPHFKAAFVDPEVTNTRAIQTYEKAGFKKIKTLDTIEWLLCMKGKEK